MQPMFVLVPAGPCGSGYVFQRACPPAGRPPKPRRLRTAAPAASATPEQPAAPAAPKEYQYTYRGSDGRLKATFEQAFLSPASGASAAAPGAPPLAPWELGYQISENSLAWNDELKTRLVKRVAAEELGLSDEEVESRLARVLAVLPDLAGRLPVMRPALVAALVGQADALAPRVLRLKAIFPGANASVLAVRQPALVLGFDMDRLAGIAAELEAMFPALDISRLVEANPSMLDLPGLRLALEEAQRIVPGMDIQRQMAVDPQVIFSFQRGPRLIPYDIDTPTTAKAHGSGPGGDGDDDEYSARQWY